jgi:beta-xylosidase
VRLPRPVVALLLGAVPMLAGLAATAPPAAAYPGAPWFEPSKPYTSNFPDPDVRPFDGAYYAYATTTGGAYLPVMRSTDLVTWTARPAYDPGPPLDSDPYFNDALPHPARWGAESGSGRITKQVWAPAVERIGGRYVLFYSIKASNSPERYCISVATASSPLGPFTDSSTGPFVCDSDPKGSIDPDPFVDPDTGTPYLLWKSEGVPGSLPTRIWAQQLDASGTAFAPGSARRELLRTSQPWEGDVVENPSMVRHGGQLYLFYSANEWASSAYATGYAVCESVLGPCTKPRGTPLLASSGDRLGPGGPSAFVDAAGRLQLAHHWWNAPYTSYPAFPQCQSSGTCRSQGQRRMAVTELRVGAGGLEVGAARPAPPVLGTDRACPAGSVPPAGYPDVPAGSTHAGAIDCVTWWRVAQGSGAGFAPAGAVTRAQMAAFLARAVLESGGALPAPRRDHFPDDDASVHQDAVNRLAEAGLVQGGSDGRYRPDAVVTREQMASFLVRTAEHRTGRRLAATQDWFGDDEGSAHAAAINAAAGAGIAGGTGGGTYSPRAAVRRDQMATFLARSLQLFVQAGAPLPR